MSADPARRVICSIISNAEFAATNSTPAGTATFRFAPTKVTLAPLLNAESARATPCFPLALLPINRIGSIASLVPPAEIKTFSPDKSLGKFDVFRFTTCLTTRAISFVSGRRPTPWSSPVNCPIAGSKTKKPRLRRVATFSLVAEFSHISVCIAGAKIIGHFATNKVASNASLAKP